MMFNQKKAISAPSTTGSLILLVVVLIGMVYFIPKLHTAAKLIVPGGWFDGVEDKVDEEWGTILEEYEAKKCKIGVQDCKITGNKNCACFTKGAYSKKRKFEICSEDKPYCYNQESGCSSVSSDQRIGIDECKRSLGSKFVQAPTCELDKFTCQVLKTPCSCPTGGAIALGDEAVYVTCIPGQYCYNHFGCSEKGPDGRLYVDACSETNPEFEVPPACDVDYDSVIIGKIPCSCHTQRSLPSKDLLPEICVKKEYCYIGGGGCSKYPRPKPFEAIDKKPWWKFW